MDETVREQLYDLMVDAGLPEDSSAELAFHIAQHFPEHGAALLGRHKLPSER